MALTGSQLEQLQDALLSAFPSYSSLAQMTLFRRNENLDAIAGTGNLDDVVFKLITWAKAAGRVDELVIKAHQKVPGNPALKAFHDQHINHTSKSVVAPNNASLAIQTTQNQIQDVIETFRTITASDAKPKLIHGMSKPLPRTEVARTEDQLETGKSVVITGEAGTGKSGIAFALTSPRSTPDMPVLFLDARKYCTVRIETDIQYKMKLNIPLTESIELLSPIKGCRVIFDQMDSLSTRDAADILTSIALKCADLPKIQVVVLCRSRELGPDL